MRGSRLSRLLGAAGRVSGGNALDLGVGYVRRWSAVQTFPNGHGAHQTHSDTRTMIAAVGFRPNVMPKAPAQPETNQTAPAPVARLAFEPLVSRSPGDWCRVRDYGRKAHLLVQGYDGLLVHCRKGQEVASVGWVEWSLPKSDSLDPGDAPRCKVCTKEQQRRDSLRG